MKILLLFFILFNPYIFYGQELKPIVEIGENKIKLNEPFVVSIIVKNDENRPKCKFPELVGFKKRTVAYTAIPVTINGKTTIDQKVSQEYLPTKIGVFVISNISIIVNDQPVVVTNVSVNVLSSEIDETEENFKDFIDGSAYEFIDVKDDAFFALTSNKLSPYVGEGFLITVAFYISQNNKAEMDFVNENVQLDAILQKIRPKNCWEENLGISEIKGNRLIKIGKKKYFQYKIFQAMYYPFNNQPIIIPALKWQMLKYKIAKDQEVSDRKMEDYKNYFSKAVTIRPLQLPKNDNFTTDFVGDFQLEEAIDKEKVQTGKSFNYTFKIRGSGNLSVIKFPESLSDSLFEIYEPKEIQQITNNLGKLIPEKSFSFDIVPKFAGKFSLKDRFFINYFNVRTKKYETLRAEKQIEVVGKDISIENEQIQIEDDLFENIANLKSDETEFDYRAIILKWANFLIIIMLVAMVYIIWPTKK
ncbi:MAG: BatD family protein [Bacteroidota bacterium]